MSRRKLTDEDWLEVFAIRCRSRRGHPITPAELRLCERALRADPTRYRKVGADVFDATVPFGSDVKATR